MFVAVLLGAAAAVATLQLYRGGALNHTPASQEDYDPGLIP
jgi:hypothetical protein